MASVLFPGRVDKLLGMILGTGIDIVEVPRIGQSIARFGERFLKRVFTAAEIRYCQETASLYHPNLEGKLIVQFGITPNGTVEKLSVQSSTLQDKTLEECIMKRLATWKFPKPKGGVHVNVSYPLIFKNLGGGD